ncbi:ABC transporter permease [Embleya sp. NPDC050154]|uniref:ABC transporter permease n=1 Tax=Embleya sp. NPDC050154 TaxID=3363988 RepID=UPI0037B80271
MPYNASEERTPGTAEEMAPAESGSGPETAPRSARPTSPVRIAAAVAVGLVVLQLLMVTLFAWPGARSEPRDLPIAVAGAPAEASALADRLERAHPGAFTVHAVADEAAARARIEDRRDYGAIVLGPAGPRLLTASAASATVAQSLPRYVAAVHEGRPVPVVDVVPAPADDPRGAGLGGAVLPLVMTGMFSGIFLTLFVPRLRLRLAGAALFAALGGLAATGLLQGWVGALSGPYAVDAGAVALLLLAVNLPIIGLAAVLGRPGIVLGAVTMFLIGNPLSGATSAPELLPQPWGTLGRLLPPGAGGNLLRSTAFFDGNGAGGHLVVLGAWIALGAVLSAASGLGLGLGRTRAA